MSADRYQRAKAIFLDACDLAASRREEFVREACADDVDLRRAVDELLEADAAPLPAFDAQAPRERLEGLLDGERETRPTALPKRIGRYRVVGLIGAGGMGAVYEAEQESPKRRVAVKVLRPGLATLGALRRFEHEAQLLGRLEHPGVARIYEADVGEVESAEGQATTQPYFAMELVKGEPLDQHAAGLALRDRLLLLARICDAVHHAHTRGVIHRDLKPANILVEPAPTPDDPGQPRILDFGVARLTNADIHEASIATSPGQILGTLGYMSPEQVAGSPDDLDTRSDVYSLGVILFELLSGAAPVDLSHTSIPEAARRIREDEPTRLGTLAPSLRGDVETIAHKALEKDRDRRYQSAAELADDIRRHLRDEPISARPPSAAYQLRKFARRNRTLVGAAGIVAIVLVAASILSTWLAVRASNARDLAEEERTAAVNEAKKYRAVLEFLQDMISAANPEVGPNRADATIKQVLDIAARDVAEGALDDTPDVAVAVKATIGNTYRALDDYDKAIEYLRESVTLGTRRHPEGNEDLSWALNKLARTLQDSGEFEESERHFRHALVMRDRIYGRESAETAIILNNLGWLRIEMGDMDEGEQLLTESLEIRRRVFGERHGEVATSLNNLALVKLRRGEPQRAAEMLRESLDIDLELKGELHPNVASTTHNLATALKGMGRYEEAEELYRKALGLRVEMFGERHTMVANAYGSLGSLLHVMGRLDEAEADLRLAYEMDRDLRGADHPRTLESAVKLGRVLTELGSLTEADALLAPALATLDVELGRRHRRSISARVALGRLRWEQGRAEDAEQYFTTAEVVARDVLGLGHPDLARVLVARARCLMALERLTEAESDLLEAHAIFEESGPPDARRKCARALADLYEAWGRLDESARWAQRAEDRL